MIKKINNSKTIICSKEEIKILEPYICNCYICELPIFSLTPKYIEVNDYNDFLNKIQSDYVIMRTINSKISENFLNSINKIWNEMYESKN